MRSFRTFTEGWVSPRDRYYRRPLERNSSASCSYEVNLEGKSGLASTINLVGKFDDRIVSRRLPSDIVRHSFRICPFVALSAYTTQILRTTRLALVRVLSLSTHKPRNYIVDPYRGHAEITIWVWSTAFTSQIYLWVALRYVPKLRTGKTT